MKLMTNNNFEILRTGTHSSFQDEGFFNVQHLGITTSGTVDNELYLLCNSLLGNKKYSAVIEFAFQGPLLKLSKGNCCFVKPSSNIFKQSKCFFLNFSITNMCIVGTDAASGIVLDS